MNKLYRIARHLHKLKLLKKATKPGQFAALDEFINGEIDQVEGLSQDSDAVVWSKRELYKKFDNGLKSKPELLQKVNEAFSRFVEKTNGDKKEANRLAYEDLFTQHHPSTFFSEGTNVHVGLGQIFYWAKSTNKDLSRSSPVTWDDALPASDKFIKSQINKGDEVTSLQALNSTDATINYFMQNPDIPDSDLHIEIIAVPRGMSEKELDDMKKRCQREGNEGAHCLYSNYWGTIKSGQATALSIRDEKGGFVATMRIDIDDLVELKGYNNAPPPDEYKQPILNWIMNLVDQGIIGKISGMLDVGNLMTSNMVGDAFSSNNEDLIAAAIMSNKASVGQIKKAFQNFPESHKVAKAIAASSKTPDDVQAELVKRWPNDQGVLSSFSMNENTSEEVIKQLLAHPNKAIRYYFFSGKTGRYLQDQVTEEDLDAMSKIENGKFNGRWMAAALAHPNISEKKIDEVLSNPNIPNSVLASILVNPNAKIETKNKIYLGMSDEERKAMGDRAVQRLAKVTTSVEVLEEMAKYVDPKSMAGKNIVYNPNATEQIKIRLVDGIDMKDKMEWVRTSKAPIEVLRNVGLASLKMSPHDESLAKHWVIKNPNSTPELLREMAKSENPYVREDVARFTKDTDLLKQMAQDKGSDVRRQVATNKNTPADALEELSKDNDKKVRSLIARNPNTPPNVLTQLAKDWASKWEVAQNQNTPKEVMMELVQDDDNYAAVTMNKNISPELLDAAVDKAIRMPKSDHKKRTDSNYVLEQAVKNQNALPETLSKVWNQWKAENRDMEYDDILENSNTPGEVLQELLDNAKEEGYLNPHLAQRFITHPKTLDSTLEWIFHEFGSPESALILKVLKQRGREHLMRKLLQEK